LHSLRYLHVAVSEPSLGVPKFTAIGYLDGIPITRYDSKRGWMEPLTQWMEDGAEQGYWDGQTQICEGNQYSNARSLDILREQYKSRGESVRGSYQTSYDGREFVSFDLGSRRFMASDSAAEITRRRWKGEMNEVQSWTNYLGHVCPEWLQKYVRCGQKELDRKDLTPSYSSGNSMDVSHHYPIPEPPDVHVSRKEEHRTLILSCHAYGFYPSTITVSWLKGDEIWDQEMEWGGIVPNSNGTFHTWATIEVWLEERSSTGAGWSIPECRSLGSLFGVRLGMWNVGIGNPQMGIPLPLLTILVSQSLHLAGISPWWSLCPSLPSSSSLSLLDSLSGGANPGREIGMDTTWQPEKTWEPMA
ncbi:hypothetical protein IHE44_0012738, partial [Lamprotornis superbus]